MVTKKEQLAALASAYTPSIDERARLAGLRNADIQAAIDAANQPYLEEPTDMQNALNIANSLDKVFTASDGKTFTDQNAYVAYENNLRNSKLTSDATNASNTAARQSAYDLLYSQFKQYGLESLVKDIEYLIKENVSPSEFAIRLQETPTYKQRFSANADRIKAGLRALTPAEYIGLEDLYQNIMRNYGLPASYWSKDSMGTQAGFNKLIAGDVDSVELEQRLIQAVDQIEKGPKEYMDAIKEFYPEISRSDLLSYVLDPTNALKSIQSKVKAAQIGGEYLRAGLGTDVTRASELATQGVTADIARANIPIIMETAQRGGELASFYQNAGLGAYDQATAEEEIYNLGKATEAKKKRQTYVALEKGSFSGKYGGAQGALDRDRSGAY